MLEDDASLFRRLSKQITKIPLLDFILKFFPYIGLRLGQLVIIVVSIFEVIGIQFVKMKDYLVHRMFWGRGSLYKSSFHIVITLITSTLLVTGILSKVGPAEASQTALALGDSTIGNYDLLEQGTSLTTVLAVDVGEVNFRVITHKVRSGDSLSSIADKYGVSTDTIKWANEDKTSYYNDNITVGDVLEIPEIDGVLYTVKAGDDLNKIIDITNSNKFDIVELNALIPPNFQLKEGQQIFVPGGEKDDPPPLTPPTYYSLPPVYGGYYNSGGSGGGSSLAGITFDNPLTHPSCAGYIISRGWLPWHHGVDLAKGGGCPIRSIAGGTVIFAGWLGGGAGYTVEIDHGNGVSSHYYHGNGVIWVRAGQQVSKGQNIMHMGTSGYSTGIHLHLGMKYNGGLINPAPYVSY